MHMLLLLIFREIGSGLYIIGLKMLTGVKRKVGLLLKIKIGHYSKA